MQSLVGAEIPGAGDLHGRARAGICGAGDDVVGGLEHQVLGRHLAAHYGSGGHGGVNQGLVAGTAAEVAVLVEPVAHLLAGRVGVLFEQDLGGNDEAGRAEAALSAAIGHPRHLQRMEVVHSAHALDGGYLGVIAQLGDLGDAGACDLAVKYDVAGAAMAFTAANLAAGQQQAVAKDFGERLVSLQHESALHPVDDEYLFYHAVFLLFYGIRDNLSKKRHGACDCPFKSKNIYGIFKSHAILCHV